MSDLPAGTALVADWSAFTVGTGLELRIDVSTEAGSRFDQNLAGSRFDQNLVGFRAEEEFAFDAEPAVRTGRVVPP